MATVSRPNARRTRHLELRLGGYLSAGRRHRRQALVPGGDGPWWEVPSISPIPGPDRTQRFLYMFIFRSARRGRCRARQLRVHGSGAAHDTTRWGCEPHTLGPILRLQGFYTTGCRVRVRHSRMSMLESSFRRGGSPSALRLEERRVASNLGVGELRPELPRGGGGGGSRGAGLSTNSTAPQLHSSTAYKNASQPPAVS